MSEHAPQPDLDSGASTVRTPEEGRTARVFSLVRAEFAARGDAAIDGVLCGLVASGDARASNRAIGDAMAVDESRVRVLRKGAAHWMVGDLLALGDSPETRTAALRIIDTLRALIVEGAPCVRLSPEMRMLGIMSRTGDLASALREALHDGHLDDDENQRLSSISLTLVADAQSFATSLLPPPPVSGPRGMKKTQMQIDTSAVFTAATGTHGRGAR